MEPPTCHASPKISRCSRLVPIYESAASNLELSPPHSPPRSPLPLPPIADNLPGEQFPVIESPNLGNTSSYITGKGNMDSTAELRNWTASPAESNAASIKSNASKEKAFISLGIGSSQQQTSRLRNISTPFEDPAQLLDRNRPDRQYLRGKKLRALNKGSPLADDSWEGTEMDDKTRQLSFSQDYHDLLADQYQEMNTRPEGIRQYGTPQYNSERDANDDFKPKSPPKDHGLVPNSLSWSKGRSGTWSLRSESQEDTETAAVPKPKPKRMPAWRPNRLSLGSRTSSESTERPSVHGPAPTEPTRQNQMPDAVVDKTLKEHLRFSLFFPAARRKKIRKKPKKTSDGNEQWKIEPLPPPSSTPPVPLMRLPGGLAIVRNTSSPAPVREVASVTEPLPPQEQPLPDSRPLSFGSRLSSPGHCSSLSYQTSNLPVAPSTSLRNKFRASVGSLYSHRLSSANPSRTPVHESPRNLPPSPSIPSSSPSSPPLSPEDLFRLGGASEPECAKQLGFIEKAKDAHRKHNREVRQERLKKSIRVLGPTDPAVMAGYVKSEGRDFVEGDRMPGYMVSGPV